MNPVRKVPAQPLIVAGVAVTALAGGAGVAMAATSGSPAASTTTAAAAAGQAASSSPGAATPAPAATPTAPRRGRLGQARQGWGGGGPFGAVHGQFVVPRSGGGYQTLDTQRGVVQKVSATSITVKSADGYLKTYKVTSSTNVDAQRDGIASVKDGNRVRVVATVNGSAATARSIVDLTLLPMPHGARPVPPSASG